MIIYLVLFYFNISLQSLNDQNEISSAWSFKINLFNTLRNYYFLQNYKIVLWIKYYYQYKKI